MKSNAELIEFNGINAIRLTAASGAEVVISRLGAQVLSWKTGDGRERLFLSERAVYDGSRAIRGGIPVCFPQFSGLGKLPKHGLVRQREWTVERQSGRDGYALACLNLDDDAASRDLWPHAFHVELTVVLEENRLDVELAVENRGEKSFAFTAALHSYLRVGEVENARLRGLQGLEYRDAAHGDRLVRDPELEVAVDEVVDRVYHDVPRPLLLGEGENNLGINAEGFPDVVVWNPWVEGCAALTDMAPLDFRRMLCVEAAAARRPVLLLAGATWVGRQSLVAI